MVHRRKSKLIWERSDVLWALLIGFIIGIFFGIVLV